MGPGIPGDSHAAGKKVLRVWPEAWGSEGGGEGSWRVSWVGRNKRVSELAWGLRSAEVGRGVKTKGVHWEGRAVGAVGGQEGRFLNLGGGCFRLGC